MRVTSLAAAGLVVIAMAAQGVTGVGLAVDALLALPQTIVLKGGLIALIVVLKILKKVKDAREQEKTHMMHAHHAPNMPYALRHMYKRSLATATPEDNLTETLTEGEEMEEVLEAAVVRLIERLDDDGCLVKLLCHLQDKPQDTLSPEEGQLANLFPTDVQGCREAFGRCGMEEVQLVEAFRYTWQLQETV
ncbi:uncharacterized protein LOC123501534 [Portunus trituberculatus]|uniref:uncharacterized protein LOC123501534 n=1 Tax=Portunus trituberculatus TaxID=210409 RepID=UPI001E1CF2B6|nr:uncharacterized protein LOC123501534 [Portunus trituberculatus]XP_045106331.1 uncharacterized protein LOC123501534 [Portunus trituberculatus]